MSYTLIFMDFNMPNLNGIEATRQIRDYLPQECQPTIIGVTGHCTNHFKEEGTQAGMQKIVPKPLYRDKLDTLLE